MGDSKRWKIMLHGPYIDAAGVDVPILALGMFRGQILRKKGVISRVLCTFEIYLSVEWKKASNVLRALVAENSSG